MDLNIKTDLKHELPVIEDAGDAYAYRPAASLFVPLLARTIITPNQVTAVSLIIGLVGVILLSIPSYAWRLTGSLVLQFSIIVDCMDGQLARLKKMTSDWGDIFDHTTDDFKLLILTVIIVGECSRSMPAVISAVVVICALGAVLCMVTSQYFYCDEYNSIRSGHGANELLKHIEKVKMMYLKRTWRTDFFPKILLSYYIFRLRLIKLFIRLSNSHRTREEFWSGPIDQSEYFRYQKNTLYLWQFMGFSVISFLMTFFVLFGRLDLFPFMCVCTFPLFIIVLLLQRRSDRLFLLTRR